MRRTLLIGLVIGAGCGPLVTRPAHAPAARDGVTHSLWEEPGGRSDLYAGAGGRRLTPPLHGGTFEYVAHKRSGKNPGFEVRDVEGRRWSVKLGEEAAPEVVLSRLLWAVGFHQPPVYYVADFQMIGNHRGRFTSARFRIDPEGHAPAANWSWYENPFVGTTEFGGLIALQVLFNNWDVKTSNNTVYAPSARGAGRHLYVVRDLGAALGKARQSALWQLLNIRHGQGTKNDLAGFEAIGFIRAVEHDRVRFAYRGLDAGLLNSVRPSEVVWACRRLDQMTDRQWADAFRAADYPPDAAARYIAKIKEKLAEGLRLSPSLVPGPRD